MTEWCRPLDRWAGLPAATISDCPEPPGDARQYSGPGRMARRRRVGDVDGVVVVPPFRAEALGGEVQARTIREHAWMGMIRNGRTTADLLCRGGGPGRRAVTQRDGS